MSPVFSGAAIPFRCCKFGQVQVHIAMSNQHICKKQTPLNRYFPISIERLPLSGLSRFCSQKGCPSCAATGAGLNGFKCANRCVFVTRFSQVPGLTLFVSLAPGASFLFSPRPPPPQPASSLPDAPLSLQGPADCLLPAAGS